MSERPVTRHDGAVHPGCRACSGSVVRKDGSVWNVRTPHATPGTATKPASLRAIRRALRASMNVVTPPMDMGARVAAYRRQNAAGGVGRAGLTDRQNRRIRKQENRAMRKGRPQ